MRLPTLRRHFRSGSRTYLSAVALVSAAALAVAGCSSPQEAAEGPTGDDTPYQVGLIYSQSGPLASYGAQYKEGFDAGLAYATGGTNKVGNHPIEVTEVDDTGDPEKAVAAARDLIGEGYKIIGGSTASGVALQVAPIAEQNEVLFISGPAATDALTGANRYTFRSGRQSYQDVVTASSFMGDADGKTVLVFAQDTAFGQANVAAVTAVIGGQGATVTPLLVPGDVQEFTTFAAQALAADADLIFVAWAGTTAATMWQALDQQGVLDATTVVTGLDIRVSWPTFGEAGGSIDFLAHYFDGASDTPASQALAEAIGGPIDLFHPDGFTAAQMMVHALEASGDDVEAMIAALEGWSFESVKGGYEVRAEDHALLQPMFQTRLTGSGDDMTAELVETLAPDDVAPPPTPFAG